MKWFLLSAVAFVGLTGCQAWNKTPPVETFATDFAKEVVFPAVRAGITQGIENLQMQTGVQGINPTYVVEFEGKWVVGIEGKATIGVEGISGQLQISATTSPPPSTQPVEAP